VTVVTFFALLGACVWVGGLVAIAVVTHTVRSELDRGAQVAFFRALGRRYLVVGGSGLAVALVAGGVLLAGRGWDGTALAAVVVAVALVLVTVAGVQQARGVTRLRVRAARDATLAAGLARSARRAGALRGAIALLSLVLLALAAALS